MLALLAIQSSAPRPDADTERWVIGGQVGWSQHVELRLLPELTPGCGNGWARRVPAASAQNHTG